MTKLDELLHIISNNHVYIQTHNYPDQDALASAFGLKILLEKYGKQTTMCYSGQVGKCGTQKMVELLHIEIQNDKEINMKKGDEIILIDGQNGNVNMMNLAGTVVACIDHHPLQTVTGYRFYDIQSDRVACAAIIAEYFVENKIEIPTDVATALCYGIKADSANLSRPMSNKDIDMFCYLYKKSEVGILNNIENNSLRKEDLIAYKEAISNFALNGRLGIAKIGDDCSEAIIGSISDFLLTLSEIECTLVYSYRVGGLKFSMRSESNAVDAGKVIKEALKGYGDGGGHFTMAAGFVPNLTSEEEIKNMASLVEERVSQLVINPSLVN